MINHITKNIDIIKNIIQNKSFKLSYCSEEFRDECGKLISHAAHPMVCFSEYSFEELPSKTITYGSYCISMKKEWAITNKLNPVLYIDKNSHVALGLKDLLLKRKKTLKGDKNFPRLAVMQIKCFTKHVKGYNSYFDEENFDFKYENEWRYVPQKKEIDDGMISLDNSKYKKNRENYNKMLEPFPLKFKEHDIELVFVSKESEIKIIEELFPFLIGKVKKYTWEYNPKN